MNAAVDSIDGLSSRLARYLSDDEIRQIRHAYLYSEQAHDGQKRRSGEPYITHPLQVAEILADMRMDHQSLMAAMLHDVIEDTGIAKDALEHQFGSAVAELVDGVSKLTNINFETRAEAQAENFQKMTLAMARDIRVIIVKLADRLHNMRTIGSLSPEKRRRIARETLDIYSPIANRLGMYELRSELHELAYRAMYPMRIERIERAVSAVSGNRKKIVAEIQEALESAVAKTGIKARVQGREKAANSIYRKMRDQRKSFTDIMDVYGFRIITDTVDECYRVLGIVHNLYKPKPGRFKDYIAIPKANGYQSLHTTLFGMHGVPIEIQIRTNDMEAMASGGIAAHWLYKTGSEEGAAVQRTNRWVKGLLEIQQRAGSSLEFIENVKIDLFPDDVYIFTPKGRIME
ncbi:MAG: RelA/SpoT family protein, partial [Litorivicinaceae bacterium]